MVLPLQELWSKASSNEKAEIQQGFGNLQPRANCQAVVCMVRMDDKEHVQPLDQGMCMATLRCVLKNLWAETSAEFVKEDRDRFFLVCDTAEDAARVALQMSRIAETLKRNTPLGKFLAGFACGLCSGEVLAGDSEVFGEPIEIATRLAGDFVNCKAGMVLMAADMLPAGAGTEDWPEKGLTTETKKVKVLHDEMKLLSLVSVPQNEEESANHFEELLEQLDNEKDPFIQRFLAVAGARSGQGVNLKELDSMLHQHESQMALFSTSIHGFERITHAEGLIKSLHQIAVEHDAISKVLQKHSAEELTRSAGAINARFDKPVTAVACAAELYMVLKDMNAITCAGLSYGWVLYMGGSDLLGWPWDICRGFSRQYADTNEAPQVVIGQTLTDEVTGDWDPPEGMLLDEVELSIAGSSMTATKLRLQADESDKAASGAGADATGAQEEADAEAEAERLEMERLAAEEAEREEEERLAEEARRKAEEEEEERLLREEAEKEKRREAKEDQAFQDGDGDDDGCLMDMVGGADEDEEAAAREEEERRQEEEEKKKDSSTAGRGGKIG